MNKRQLRLSTRAADWQFVVTLLILFVNVFTPLKASDVDSLKHILNTFENDKSIYKTCRDIGTYYQESDVYDSAIYYYSLPLSNENTESKHKLLCYKKIGSVYIDSANFVLALEYLNKAIVLNEKVKAIDEYPSLYDYVGMCYGLTNKLDEAITAFEKGLEYNVSLKDSSGIGFSYYNIGLANHFKGQYDKAIENFVNSANIREAICDTTPLVASLTSIGEIFRLRNDFTNAEFYYNKALKYKQAIDSKEILAYLYSEMALIFKSTKQYETAFCYIDTAMDYSLQIDYKRGIVTLLNYKAGIYVEQGRGDEALAIYGETIKKYKEIGFEPGLIQSNIALAKILFNQEGFSEVLKIMAEVEPLALDNNLLDEQCQIADLKYQAYKNLGKVHLALGALEQFVDLNDSLFNVQKEERINEIETKYETTQKEQQIELLDKENKIKAQKIKSRNFVVSLLVALVFSAVLVFVLLQNRRKALSQLEIEKNKHRLLRAQMNPHFIYNALSAIQNFILKNNPMDSVTYISEFSSLTRLVLEGARCDLISMKDDVKLVNAYLKLQQMRFGNKFSYVVEVDKSINDEVVKLPPMLSQPFIENAVEHGMRNKKDGEGEIVISYKKSNGNLVVLVSDNGEGIQKSESSGVKKHQSLASKITNERIENIRKAIGVVISLNIHSGSSGTSVEFIISQKK